MRKLWSVAAVIALTVVLFGTPSSAAATTERGGSTQSMTKILLNLEHPRGLKRFARQVSSPGSPRYRRYRSTNRLIKRFGASKKTRRRTLSWLQRRGIDGRTSRTRTWVTADVAADDLPGELFGRSARRSASDGKPAGGNVPAGLHGVVDSVAALSSGPVAPPAPQPARRRAEPVSPNPPSSQRPRTGTPAGCAAGRDAGQPAPYQAFTPNQYTTAYGHADLQRRGFTGRGQRIALIETDGFKRSDIAVWAECFGLQPPPIKRHRVGPRGALGVGGETNLDLEVLTAAAPGVEAIDVYTTGVDPFALALLEAVPEAYGTRKHPSDVISMSLGVCEAQQYGVLAYARALNGAFAIAAGAGISTLVASQDRGSSACDNEAIGALPLLAASFPATSPFVTAVGGTNLVLDEGNRITDQITWNDKPNQLAASGGGASILFKRPWYQRGTIRGSAVGKARTVPDVAALADITPGYAIYCSRRGCGGYPPNWNAIGGTSAATPLLAGGVALANERAERAGQPNLGMLNPLLYEVGKGKNPTQLFDDVTDGGNDAGVMIPAEAGGGRPLGCCPARPGYDLATGWGSADVRSLSRIALRAAR